MQVVPWACDVQGVQQMLPLGSGDASMEVSIRGSLVPTLPNSTSKSCQGLG